MTGGRGHVRGAALELTRVVHIKRISKVAANQVIVSRKLGLPVLTCNVQMLASAAAPINKQDLPSIQDRPGLSVPTKGTLLSANVQFMADNDGDTGAAEDAGIDGAAFQPMQMDLSELPGAGLGKPDDQDADAMDTNQMLPEPL
jgi:hypothetical protein